MTQPRLNKLELPMDRWSAAVVSPVDIGSGIDADKYGPVVVVHPGWGKGPARHGQLLIDLANEGFLPLGVDTRYAYADRQLPQPNLLKQPRTVGNDNPYFPVDCKSDNQYLYRRPTVLLDICERLGIGRRSYVGHSKGGLIVTLAALADPHNNTNKLIVVNGAGTGDSSSGVKRLARSNLNQVHSMFTKRDDIPTSLASGLGSLLYAGTHLRRTLAEKRFIQAADTWAYIDQLEGQGTRVTVAHARDDELISFEDCAERAATRPWVDFFPTEGGHSNVYEVGVRKLIVGTVLQ
jgi:pimeloyl-ACP methyl ester carboxylesterase